MMMVGYSVHTGTTSINAKLWRAHRVLDAQITITQMPAVVRALTGERLLWHVHRYFTPNHANGMMATVVPQLPAEDKVTI